MNKIFPGCRLFSLNFDICSKGQVYFDRRYREYLVDQQSLLARHQRFGNWEVTRDFQRLQNDSD
jgi:hypothetical protein